jgi:hypothetical protein
MAAGFDWRLSSFPALQRRIDTHSEPRGSPPGKEATHRYAEERARGASNVSGSDLSARELAAESRENASSYSFSSRRDLAGDTCEALVHVHDLIDVGARRLASALNRDILGEIQSRDQVSSSVHIVTANQATWWHADMRAKCGVSSMYPSPAAYLYRALFKPSMYVRKLEHLLTEALVGKAQADLLVFDKFMSEKVPSGVRASGTRVRERDVVVETGEQSRNRSNFNVTDVDVDERTKLSTKDGEDQFSRTGVEHVKSDGDHTRHQNARKHDVACDREELECRIDTRSTQAHVRLHAADEDAAWQDTDAPRAIPQFKTTEESAQNASVKADSTQNRECDHAENVREGLSFHVVGVQLRSGSNPAWSGDPPGQELCVALLIR